MLLGNVIVALSLLMNLSVADVVGVFRRATSERSQYILKSTSLSYATYVKVNPDV
jgi:hypothetical protein